MFSHFAHILADVADSSTKSDYTNPSYPWQTNPCLCFSRNRFPGNGSDAAHKNSNNLSVCTCLRVCVCREREELSHVTPCVLACHNSYNVILEIKRTKNHRVIGWPSNQIVLCLSAPRFSASHQLLDGLPVFPGCCRKQNRHSGVPPPWFSLHPPALLPPASPTWNSQRDITSAAGRPTNLSHTSWNKNRTLSPLSTAHQGHSITKKEKDPTSNF